MIKPEVKRAWVQALRSGQWEQGTEFIRSRDNKFCCLGVLCDLGRKKNWLPIQKDHEGYFYDYLGLTSDEFLPGKLPEAIGLESEQMDILIGFNDANMPFSDIADWIDKNL